eukprot:jgi/Astpho2/9159/Aster-07803
MQHYQVPSAQYSSYINHVINLGLAGDYIAQLHGSCSPDSPRSLRAAINQACRHLSGVVDDLQPVPVSALGVHTLETLGQQNGAPIPDAAVGFAATMPSTPEEEARILRCTQHINARHGAAKPQNTVQAEKSAAKLWKRYCEQEASPDGDLMSQAKMLEFSIWLVDEAVQQNGARYSFSSVGDYLCHHKEVRREQYSQGRITSDVPAPLEIQAVRDLVRARGKEMQAENLNAQVAAQVDAALSAGQLRQSLQKAFQQKQWQWACLLRMAMTFMPATLGRSDDLRKLPWSCLALRTQDDVGPMPSVAILCGSMQGKTVKPGQVDIPGVVRYRDHRICPQAALADLAVATFHRGIKLEDLANYIVAAPSMQGNQPMSGQTLNVHLRQAFDLAGVPCGRLDGYSTKGEVSHKFKKHGVEAAKSVGINKAEIKMAARHKSDTTDLYCIFDPDTAHRLAGCGWDWKENHRLGQADFKAEEDVLDRIIPGLTVLLHQAGINHALTLFPAMSQAFFKTQSGKEATPMPVAPVVMLAQVPLSSAQPPASANPMPWVPLASKASYGVTLPPQALSALSPGDERDSFLIEKQSIAFQLERLCTGQTLCGSSQISRQSEALEAFSKISAVPSDLRRWHGSKKEARASSMAFSRFKNGIAAEVRNRMAALGSTMAAVVGAVEMERERISATRTVSSLQQLCSRYSSDSKLLGKRKQSS